MFDYCRTSKLRRKMQSKFTNLGDKIHVELSSSLNDLTAEVNPIKKQIKRFLRKQKTTLYSDDELSELESPGLKRR